MESLIFQLQAPLSSWGDTAVGEYRPSADYPSQSAIQGLLAAALGIDRDDEMALAALVNSFSIAIAVLSPGQLLRDYHTTQVPGRVDLKNRPQATRRDELAIPKHDLNTILSSRDYRQNAASLVAIQVVDNAAYSLETMATALQKPKFVLYLGRKSCPLAAPLYPFIINAKSIYAAFIVYQEKIVDLWKEKRLHHMYDNNYAIKKMVWGDELALGDSDAVGVASHFSIVRNDRVIARKGWQFGNRNEYIALLEKE